MMEAYDAPPEWVHTIGVYDAPLYDVPLWAFWSTAFPITCCVTLLVGDARGRTKNLAIKVFFLDSTISGFSFS